MRRGFLAIGLTFGLIAGTAAPAHGSTGVYPNGGLTFGPQTIGTASAPQTLHVSVSQDPGFSPSFSGFHIAPPYSLCEPLCAYPVLEPDFVGTTDCPLGAGWASCHIYVTLRPVPPAGPKSATLWIDFGNGGAYHAPLSGSAVAPPRRNCKKHKPRSAQTAKKRCKKRR